MRDEIMTNIKLFQLKIERNFTITKIKQGKPSMQQHRKMGNINGMINSLLKIMKNRRKKNPEYTCDFNQ